MRLRPRYLTLMASGVAGAATALIALVPTLRFAYRAPELHIAFDTAEGLIALLAAYLVFGRMRERLLVRDALLVLAFLLIGVANLFLLAAPAAVLGGARAGSTPVWGSLIVRVIGSSAIAWASWSGGTTVGPAWTRARNLTLLAVSALVLAVVVGRSIASEVGLGLAGDISPTQTGPVLAGNAWLLTTQLILVALFTIAAIGFTRMAEDERADPFLRWLGPGTALSAIARFNFFLFPSIYTDYIYVGDFLRLGFYLLVLYGASQEIRLYWRRLEDDIVERDRLNTWLEALSLTDALTGLNNRRGFETLAEHEIRLAQRLKRPLALLFIDLDEMKSINDVHGHDVGDQALRETAELLKNTFREADLLARLGGDEFTVMTVSDPTETQIAIERLKANVEVANAVAERPYSLSLSVGASYLDPKESEAVDLQTLIDRADEQMYAEKRAHKRPLLDPPSG